MITEVDGDIFEGNENLILHGCNCFCTMGAGFAKEIARRYPGAASVDKNTVKGDRKKLGNYTMWLDPDISIYNGAHWGVLNLYTQYDYGRDGKCRFDYEAFEKVLLKLCENFGEMYSFAMPPIGCGLAGGDINRVREILKRVFGKSSRRVVIYHYKKTTGEPREVSSSSQEEEPSRRRDKPREGNAGVGVLRAEEHQDSRAGKSRLRQHQDLRRSKGEVRRRRS